MRQLVLEAGDSRPCPSTMILYCMPDGSSMTPCFSAFSFRNSRPAAFVHRAVGTADSSDTIENNAQSAEGQGM